MPFGSGGQLWKGFQVNSAHLRCLAPFGNPPSLRVVVLHLLQKAADFLHGRLARQFFITIDNSKLWELFQYIHIPLSIDSQTHTGTGIEKLRRDYRAETSAMKWYRRKYETIISTEQQVAADSAPEASLGTQSWVATAAFESPFPSPFWHGLW